jgi:predicted MPP superfamily phosphohydrolase
MSITWLHISDFHFRAGDQYDRDVVLRALIESVKRFREDGRAPDLIFATGDIAYSGKAAEYGLATQFFDDLLRAAKLERRHLFVVSGNHDVDRTLGIGLARTLESREEADTYFGPDVPLHHLQSKQRAFKDWYNRYFSGIRSLPENSTCGPVEAFDTPEGKIGVLPINSALFCQDDDDHGKLWVGRRCLDAAIEELRKLDAQINVALLHHPLDWLHSAERSNIKTKLHESVDFILRGHLTRVRSRNRRVSAWPSPPPCGRRRLPNSKVAQPGALLPHWARSSHRLSHPL